MTFSLGLGKSFANTEHLRTGIQATFTNILNHTNYDLPNLNISSDEFGQITSATLSDFGGNRTGQVGARVEF